MSLNSAKKITRRSWDTIPMPDAVISRINELAYNELDQFIFTDCRGRPIGYIYISEEWIGILLIATKIRPQKILLTSYRQQNR